MANLLLVDDDPGIRNMYGRLLRGEGHNVYEAGSAEAATEILIRGEIDLVLLDINMPEIDGKYFRSVIEDYDENLKVLITSVYPLVWQRRFVPNAVEYFDKSHGTDMLIHLINKTLRAGEELNDRGSPPAFFPKGG